MVMGCNQRGDLHRSYQLVGHNMPEVGLIDLGLLFLNKRQHLLPIVRIDNGGFTSRFVNDEVHPVV
jgi:hypothetical protein